MKLCLIQTLSGKLTFNQKGTLKFIAANFNIFYFIVMHRQMYFFNNFFYVCSEVANCEIYFSYSYNSHSDYYLMSLQSVNLCFYTQNKILSNVCQSIYHLILNLASVKVPTINLFIAFECCGI